MLLALWLAYWPCQTLAGPDTALDLVLVLDNSQATGSADPERRLVALLDELITSLGPDTRVGLVAFDDLATPLVPLTRLADGSGKQIIDALDTLGFAAGQSNFAAGLERAIYELTQKPGADARRVILLQQSAPIAVGDPEKDRAFRRWAVEVLAGKAANAGIELWVISLGLGADPALGSTLAQRTGGVAVDSASGGELPRAITALRQRLNQTGPPREPTNMVAAASPPVTSTQSSAPEIDTSTPPEPVREVPPPPDATADRGPAPQSMTIAELERLPEPVAGPAITEAAIEKASAGWKWPSDPDWDWQLPSVLLDAPIRQAAAIAAVVLILITATLWYRRRLRRSQPPAPTAAKAPARTARLVDVGGVTGRSTYTLGDKLARVSRMPGTDTDNVVTVHIPEDVISRSHAFIELRRGAYWITDPGSNNGTFVNGKRIEGSAQLKHGDSIKFASHEFRFEYTTGGAAADRKVAAGHAQDLGEAATTVYADGGADSRTTLAPQRADLQGPGAVGGDTDQDPTVVRPAS